MRSPFVRLLLAAALTLVASAGTLTGQVGSTTDIITGKVTDTTGRPIENATVTATSIETRVSRSRTTGKDGRYTILFPDGGGQYRLTVRAIGVAPQTAMLTRQGDEDRLEKMFKMTVNATPQNLQAVTVQARRPQGQGIDRPAPGGQERTFTADQQSRLPIDANDLNTLAALAPGVVGVGASDSTGASFAVAGQRTTQNNLTLDGISFGSGSIPSEAIRGTRVITSTYDVARGQFTGGQIATTTRSGTNVLQGSATLNMRDPSLQWTPSVNSSFGQGYNQASFSAGLGGPVIEDRLFYFGALQWRQQLNPIQTVTSADSLSLVRLGLAPDSVSRFLGQIGALGLSPTVGGIPGRRTNNNLTGIARVDFNITDEHTLTLRGDYRWTEQDASRIGSYSTPNHGGNAGSTGGGLQATLTSRMGQFVHEAKGYVSTDNRDADPYVDYPEGRVRLSSALPDGTTSITSLTFGANPGLPTLGSNRGFEGTDELSYISDEGDHRIKLGMLYNWQEYDQNSGFNRNGSYTYNTLADFLTNTPALYTRTLGDQRVTGSSVNSALYLGDVWRLSRSLQLTYGVRGERSNFAGAPARNAALATAFGLRTDEWRSETHVSPRIGFTYTIFGDGDSPAPVWFIRGGFGEFRGRTPSNLYSSAQQGNGLGTGLSQVTCLGPSVPGPTWSGFASGGTASPSACVGGGAPITSLSTPQVTAFSNDFEAPRSWRGNLSLTRRFWERWTASIDAQYAWGEALYGVRDVNLNTTPSFTLGGEAGRPVFVSPTSIDTITGFTTVAGSRINPSFAQVYEIGSKLNSKTAQITASLNAFTDKGILLNFSYTYQRAWDQSSWSFGPPLFGFSQPTTASNPNINEWAASDLERRHNVVGTVTWPLGPSLEITFIGRLTAGGRYAPLVGSDINGDGTRNDRAFVFNPATTTDTAVANGMTRLLSRTSGEARSCLLNQMGGLASRNSCQQPWVPGLDLQLNWRPDSWGLQRRLALSLSFINPLAGLDQAINGENKLQGWGQPAIPDGTLLYVRGFNRSTNTYKYEVNERFGNTINGAQAFRQPFLLQLQARFTYGQNATQERFGFAMGGGGGPGGGGGGGGFGALNNSRVMNPLAQLLEMKDSLKLTEAQVKGITLLSDSLAARATQLGVEIRAQVAKAGNNPDPAVLFSSLRPKLEEGRKNISEATKAAQALLTPEQWKLVPESVKNPFAGMFGGPQGQQRRPGEQRP